MRLMTANDVAKYLGINVRTVYRKAENGLMPCYRVGRLVRFKKEEIDMSMKEGNLCQKSKYEEPKLPRNVILSKE